MERLCSICERNPIWSSDEDKDYCLFCFFTGRYFERVLSSEDRSNLLSRIRAMDKVVAAEVWHHGQGMFNLAITLRDGRLVIPGVPAEAFGQPLAVPMIPPEGGEWRLTVMRPAEDQEDEWATTPTVLPDTVDDEGLVKLIEEIA